MPKASKLQVKEKKKWERERGPVETKACSLKKKSRKEKKRETGLWQGQWKRDELYINPYLEDLCKF